MYNAKLRLLAIPPEAASKHDLFEPGVNNPGLFTRRWTA